MLQPCCFIPTPLIPSLRGSLATRVGLLSTLLLSATALADPTRLYVGSAIRSGGALAANSQSTETEHAQAAPAWSLLLEIPDKLETDMHFYASHSAHSMKPLSTEKINFTTLQLGGVKYIEPAKTKPYLGATIGGTLVATRDIQQLQPSFSLYGGAHWALGKQAAFKLEARWLGVYFKGDQAVLCDAACNIRIRAGLWSQYEVGAWLGFGF